jgi:hypothetical protein
MIGLISLSRSLDRALAAALRLPAWVFRPERTGWLSAIVQPLRLVLWLVVLRIAVEILDPSAIARLYLGRAMGITFAGALAWCLIRLVTLFMDHLEARLDQRQQLASRAMLRLGRRGVTLTIVVLTILALLQNLGYNTSAPGLETVSTPARVVALASGAFSLEIFCYVLTSDIDQFYRVQGDLLFRINDIFKASNVELV